MYYCAATNLALAKQSHVGLETLFLYSFTCNPDLLTINIADKSTGLYGNTLAIKFTSYAKLITLPLYLYCWRLTWQTDITKYILTMSIFFKSVKRDNSIGIALGSMKFLGLNFSGFFWISVLQVLHIPRDRLMSGNDILHFRQIFQTNFGQVFRKHFALESAYSFLYLSSVALWLKSALACWQFSARCFILHAYSFVLEYLFFAQQPFVGRFAVFVINVLSCGVQYQ